jgi:hypothetical protein
MGRKYFAHCSCSRAYLFPDLSKKVFSIYCFLSLPQPILDMKVEGIMQLEMLWRVGDVKECIKSF